MYETVIDIREKRAIVEEKLVDMLKNIEDVKKTIERMKQREKQIDKDFRQTEAEIQQFQLQKQGSLNQIDIVVPLNVSQLYTFESSGALSGPEQVDANAQPAAMIEGESLAESATKLRDIERRMLINEIGSKSHILFSERLALYSLISVLVVYLFCVCVLQVFTTIAVSHWRIATRGQ